MAKVWKAIKPAKLKEDAVRLELLNAMRKVGRGIKKDYERSVKTWDDKPTFKIQISLKQPGPTVTVTTESVIYGYVDKGTEPHLIVPVNASVLAFQASYKSKTVPGTLDARHGGPSGPTVFAAYVEHPGSEARRFSELIEQLWRTKYKREMEAAMRRAAKKSGNYVR